MTGASEAPVAVVDIGSGAVKLLVVDGQGLAGRRGELARHSAKTHLGPGQDGLIPDAAFDATAAALDTFSQVIARHRPVALAVVGTAWARAVSNLDRLEDLVADKLGVALQVLTGDREAALSFAGAVAGRRLTGPVSVIDLGAASTEFALRAGDGPLHTLSVPIGGRTITDDYLPGDPPRPDELSSALSVVGLHIDDVRREIPHFAESVDGGTVIGVGAISQIAEVEIGLVDPDSESVDGYRMDRGAVEEVFRALATESALERAGNPGLRPEHVADIVGALCVLVEFMRQFSAPEILVSERGLMHGLAAELMVKR